MNKSIFANMGFLLQISGLLTLLPIGIGLAFKEIETIIPLFIVCVSFLGLGFLMNALCERKDLDFKSSNILFVGAFILLPLIGAIPYFYNDPFTSATILDRFTNGYFESVSGFTTTGFSFIAAPETLPVSLLVYRSLTELMGGVGIVFLLLAFFQSKQALRNLGSSIGVDNVGSSLRRTFLSVFAIYGIFILAFTGIFFALGFQNPITTGTFVIDTLTGGYQPSVAQFSQYLALAPKIFIIILMLFGGLNFAFSYHLFTLKPRKAITSEILAFFAIIAIGTAAVALLAQVGVLDSLFHVVSMSSSVGYSYLPLFSFNNTAYGNAVPSILFVIMIIGGCAFSMAGGIRVSRIIAAGKAIKENVRGLLVRENGVAKSTKAESVDDRSLDNLSASVSILMFIFTLVIFAVIFTTIGVSFQDALFEVGSALTTNGISMGATNLTMGIGYKWLMIAAMTIGRIEILAILIALFPLKKEKNKE
jgi:trk system potassium uptake protein TrkH